MEWKCEMVRREDRTSEEGVVTMRMNPKGTPPTKVNERKDGFWYSYSPDGKYIAMVVADLDKAVVSAARMAAKSTGSKVGEGVAPDAIASSSGSLHPATPRWLEIIDANTFQTLHKLEGVAGLEEYFYWSPRSRYIVTWQPTSVPSASSASLVSAKAAMDPISGDSSAEKVRREGEGEGEAVNASTNQSSSEVSSSTTSQSNEEKSGSTSGSSSMLNGQQNAFSSSSSSSTSSSSSIIPNLKVWDVQTGKVVMHFKHAQRQGWPNVRWTEDEKIAARWASGQIHLYHWAKASFHLSPEENFAGMHRETIDKHNVWDWSVARSALAIFIKENSSNNTPANVHLYPLNTSLGDDLSINNNNSESNETKEEVGSASGGGGGAKKSGSSSNNNAGAAAQPGAAKKGKAKKNALPQHSAPPKEPNLQIIEPAAATKGQKNANNNGSAVAVAQSPSSSSSSSSSATQESTNSESTTTKKQVMTTLAPAEPISTKSFYNCDDVSFQWHNRGQALLVLATTQRDQSGANNYYGNTYVYYLPADGKGECDVTTDKKGPIHDVRWNAKGNDFAVTYGEYPSKTALYNRKCKALGHLGTESRNKLVWSPQGRVLLSGGFGQLPGNFDIWDTVSLTKLGSAQSFTSAHHEWTPDGKFLLTAALWPRMRIDNFFSIYDLKANLLFLTKLPEVWKVGWRPMPGCASAYPPSPQSPIVVAPPPQLASASSSSSAAAPKPAEPYRPPHAKRAANSQFALSQVPLKEAKVAPERFAPPSAKPHSPVAPSPSPSSSTPSPKLPIGGTPVGGSAKKSSSSSSPSSRPHQARSPNRSTRQ